MLFFIFPSASCTTWNLLLIISSLLSNLQILIRHFHLLFKCSPSPNLYISQPCCNLWPCCDTCSCYSQGWTVFVMFWFLQVIKLKTNSFLSSSRCKSKSHLHIHYPANPPQPLLKTKKPKYDKKDNYHFYSTTLKCKKKKLGKVSFSNLYSFYIIHSIQKIKELSYRKNHMSSGGNLYNLPIWGLFTGSGTYPSTYLVLNIHDNSSTSSPQMLEATCR